MVKVTKIYIDMDGVLVDFDKWKNKHAEKYPKILTDKSEFWRQASKVDHLYLHLDPMPEAKTLLEYLHSLDIPLAILTGIPQRNSVPDAERDKRVWNRKFAGNLEFNIGPYASQKQRFSGEGLVLIDDKAKNITEWKQRGGIGILYTDFESCKAQLKEHLRESL
jgi:phosphoglycolate phosphatase-like HAD superfamily hydrolase